MRWDDHNAERRKQVLDAAVAVIEGLPAGAEVKVQQIADRAGLVRTVVYRHFDGRADLNRALQAHVVGMMRAEVEPKMTFDGTISEIITRIVSAYVGWAAAHPNLYLMIERELGDGVPSEMVAALQAATESLAGLIRAGADVLGVRFDAATSAHVDLLVVGIIGQVRGTVSHWIRRQERGTEPTGLATLLSKSIWFQIDGFARTLGATLEPDLPVSQLARYARTGGQRLAGKGPRLS